MNETKRIDYGILVYSFSNQIVLWLVCGFITEILLLLLIMYNNYTHSQLYTVKLPAK